MSKKYIKQPIPFIAPKLCRTAKVAIPVERREEFILKIYKRLIVNPTTGCWHWIGKKDRRGYGRLCVDHGRQVFAYRAAYECFKGDIPKGLVIDHLCKNPSCVNPEHLEPVTQAENARRGRMAKITPVDVIAIRDSPDNNTVVAKKYGLHPSTVCDIRKGNRWAS